jgi:hypothetical protein
VDNELSQQHRLAVEEFVEKNPDLNEELEVLMQFKFSPDTEIVFPSKEQLTRVEDGSPINAANYNEWLTLYLDNELTTSENAIVEDFLAKNPVAKAEMDLLQRVKLQPETVIMPGKDFLYRKEPRKIPLPWWRVAAAILLLLSIGITTAIILNNKNTKEQNIAGNQKKIEPVKTPVIENKNEVKEQDQPIVTNNQENNKSSIKEPKINLSARNNNKVKGIEEKKPEFTIPVKTEEPVIVKTKEIKQSNNLPQPLNNPNLNRPAPNNNSIADVANSKVDIPVDIPSKNVTNNAEPTSYKPDEEKKNQSGGLRGFLRKVGRTFQKRTNIASADDDDRLLIGGLALKLN